jgi:hypothetical protein
MFVVMLVLILVTSATNAASMPCSTHCRDEALLHYLSTREFGGRAGFEVVEVREGDGALDRRSAS